MRTRLAGVLMAGTALIAAPAHANDSVAELATGGLVLKSDARIEMKREHLSISPQQIAVDYVFHNRDSRDVTATVAFPMPELTMSPDLMVAIPDADSEDVFDFTVEQDGQRIVPKLDIRAISDGQDITDELKAQNIPAQPGSKAAAEALARLPEKIVADWEARGLIETMGYDVGNGPQTENLPLWSTRQTWYWETVFPAGRDVTVKHRYTPIVGGSSTLTFVEDGAFKGESFEDFRTRYCMEPDFLKSVKARIRPGGDAIPQRSIAYVLGTGGNWAGGRIGNFTLTVDKGSPDALVSFCGTGVEKIGPTTFRMKARDYAPPEMVEVLIVGGTAE